MIRFALTLTLSLLCVGCQTAAHSPKPHVIAQAATPAKQFWNRTAKMFQPLMLERGSRQAEINHQFTAHLSPSDILPVNNTSHSLYQAGSIFPSSPLSTEEEKPEIQAESESPPRLPAEPLVADPLVIQTGDSEDLKRLLREIAVVPPEERKVDGTKLAALLTSFRKETMDTEIEAEYLPLLRKRILPESESLETAAPHPHGKLLAAARSASKPASEPNIEYEEEMGEEPSIQSSAQKSSQQKSLQQKSLPRREQRQDTPVVAQHHSAPASPVYPSLTQLPAAAPATIQAGYAQNHVSGVPHAASSGYGAGDWQAPTRQAIEQLRYAIEQTPHGRTVSNEMRLRMLEMLLGNKAEAAKPMPSAEKTVNEFMGHQILGLSAMLDDSPSENRSQYTSAAYRFNEGLSELQKMCPMKLKNVMFVKEWFGFGQYIPHTGEFYPGDNFSIYFEMENPKTRAVDGFEVCMAVSYEIRDQQANIVVKQDAGKPADRTLSRKRDYCLAIPGTLPATMKPGQYQLRISVTDMNDDSMQYVEEQIPFKVAPSLAGE